MTDELPKAYDPKKVEERLYRLWEKEGHFRPKAGSKGSYCVVMPPPNVTGRLHIGHALNLTVQDVLVRHRRMLGHETLLIPGTDHAGIATQNVVERELAEKEGLDRRDLGREAFLERVWKWREEHGGIIGRQQRLLGVSADWSRELFTMDPEANEAVRHAFVRLYDEELIYQDDYIVNWDPALRSAISDAEVEHREVQGAFHHVLYPLAGGGGTLEIATTRPETMLGDTAVCVNPDDGRHRHLVGKKAVVPIVGREVPIIADSYVDMEKGTGCLKVTPGHDFNDFEIGRRHNLPVITVLREDGTLNDNAPAEFRGLSVKEARKAVVKRLDEEGLLKKVEPHVHQVGHGNRSGAVIEPLVSRQWFLNVRDMARDAVRAVKDGRVRFHPKEWENTFFAWLDDPKDWCISRQLWWGHRIPVFRCDGDGGCGHVWAAERDPPSCPKCKRADPSQDPDVLDTWFSSALWPLSVLGWPSSERMKEKDFKKFFPTSTLVTGNDIIFFWVARMVMMSLKFRDGEVPFKDVYINPIVRDKKGRKMSKSLGNGIDPIDMIDRYGADALRFTLASGSGTDRTFNLDPALIEVNRHFVNKIWNAFLFIHPFLGEASKGGSGMLEDDHEYWILSELSIVADQVDKNLGCYRLDEVCRALHGFVYDKFCSWFIELSKPILHGKGGIARSRRASTLVRVFKDILMLLHPICPFVTEELWRHFSDADELSLASGVCKDWLGNMPVVSRGSDVREHMEIFIGAVRAARNLRAQAEMPPKERPVFQVFVRDYQDRRHRLTAYTASFKELAGASEVEFLPNDASRPSGSLMAVTENMENAEVFLLLDDLERARNQAGRLKARLVKLKKKEEKLMNKIGNSQFLDKADPDAKNKVFAEAASTDTQIKSLRRQLKHLEGEDTQ